MTMGLTRAARLIYNWAEGPLRPWSPSSQTGPVQEGGLCSLVSGKGPRQGPARPEEQIPALPGASWFEGPCLGNLTEPALVPSGGQDTRQGLHRPTLGSAF